MRAKKNKKKVKESIDFGGFDPSKDIIAVDTNTVFFSSRNSMYQSYSRRIFKDACNMRFGRFIVEESLEEKVRQFEEEQEDSLKPVIERKKVNGLGEGQRLHMMWEEFMQNPLPNPANEVREELQDYVVRGHIHSYIFTDDIHIGSTKFDEKCSICGGNIHYPDHFPADLPKRFWLCCRCHAALVYGTELYERVLSEPALLKEHLKIYQKDFDRIFNLEVF